MNNFLEKACCKINIGLEIVEKRSDGYHNINTIFQKITLFDIIEISEAKELSVECQPNLNISQESNICYKAFRLLQNYFNITDNAKISIKKNIPDGAGLGGGSADAAAIIKYFQQKYEIRDDTALFNIAKQLGADVPFFLNGNTAHAKGIGDELDYFDLDIPYSILLINPGVKINTAWAYKKLKITEKREYKNLKSIICQDILEPEKLKKDVINDFESVIFNTYPLIENIKHKLYDNGAIFALMSGSGSTMYSFFRNARDAERAAGLFGNYFCCVCDAKTSI